ncbi:MAG: hypothetical protein LBB42_05735 [Coriobacteriales bacterium]|jgi:glutamate--cysteine ligase|nr:hypothetical protein [Coriobacteriales bacterium]
MNTNCYSEHAFAIANHLAQGAVGHEGHSIGFELEHFIVDAKTGALVPYYTDPKTGKPGVDEVLERLAEFFDERIYEKRSEPAPEANLQKANTEPADDQSLIALNRHKTNITLEPGAQLEISIGPAAGLAEIETEYLLFRSQLDPLLAEMGYEAREYGYHPTACAHEIPLIPKDRYYYMAEHFTQTGKHGICMMRATAATQTSIDYVDEFDAVNKLRIAHALGPFFAFLTDNSPVFEGSSVGALSQNMQARQASHVHLDAPVHQDPQGAQSPQNSQSSLPTPNRMARTACWDDCDPERCLTPANLFSDDFGFKSYAETLLDAPAIFTVDTLENGEVVAVAQGFTPFSEALTSTQLDQKTIEHVLSLFFYDARFKQYVEVRQADSMPFAYSLAFTALIKGLFYNEEALEHYEECFAYLDVVSIARAKTALRTLGYEATVYQRSATLWLDEIITFAQQGLPKDEQHYLTPLAELVAERKTMLDAQGAGA